MIFHLRVMASQGEDIRKALFTSPGVDINEQFDINSKSVTCKFQIEMETDAALKNTQKENHEKRMKKFRTRAKYLHEDAWMYPSLDELIGLK